MNTVILGIFIVLAVLTVGSALMVVTVRSTYQAASWLASSSASAAALVCLLQAPFVGVVQVIVAVVAVAMMFGLALRLTDNDPVFTARQLFRGWWLAAVGAVVLFGLVLVPVLLRPGLPGGGSWPRTDLAAVAPADSGVGTGAAVAGITEIGRSLIQEFVLPFEIMAMLLLVGIVGTIVIVRRAHDDESLTVSTLHKRIARIYSVE